MIDTNRIPSGMVLHLPRCSRADNDRFLMIFIAIKMTIFKVGRAVLIKNIRWISNRWHIITYNNLNILNYMRHILTLLLLGLLLLTPGLARRNKQKLAEQTQTKDERKTVVEANHFFSNYETNTTYDIDSVEKDKSLVFYLRQQPGKADEKALADNPITIILDAGSDKSTCIFDSYTKLCSLSKVTSTSVKLQIECKKTPCELSWEIVQPAVQEDDGDSPLDQLVAVNADNNHAVLKVSCANPELKESFADSVQLYTNSRYKRVPTKMGGVYFLFDNEEKGYYYLTTEDDKVHNCANASLMHANETIVWNDPKQLHRDFLGGGSNITYEFKTIPTSDFRIEFSAHDIGYQKLTNSTGVQVGLVGYKGNDRTQLENITLFVDDEKEYIEFSAVFKKRTEKYDRMELVMKGVGNMLILQTNYVANDLQDIEFGEESYFMLNKGEKVKYRIVPLVQSSDSDIKRMNIFVDDAKFKASEKSCEPKGCTFEVEALETGKGSLYIGEGEVKNTKEIIVVPFEKSVTKKIREGEEAYFSMKLKAKNSVQLLINTPNAVAYAASKTKCPTVDEDSCFEKVLTYHSPTIYESTAEDTLLIKVIALDNAEFTITVIDSNTPFIVLQDTVPFTYLFDNEEKSLLFQFKVPNKQDVSFNLIGPTNQLNLLAINKEKPEKGDEQNADWATDGFIRFEKKDLNTTTFFAKVEKKEGFANKWVHFTLIASTKEGNMRLEPGVAHYDNIKPSDTKDYVFEFVPKKEIMLNFYTHNIKENVKLKMKVSTTDDYKNDENTAEFVIDQEVDVLDLHLVSKKLCNKEEENCELFVRIENAMDVEADVTITLLLEDAVVELKDGLWQNYNINLASISSHFYFIPNHQNHSTTIFYKSTVVDLKIMYSLWKTDDKSMDPSEWPFPMEFKENPKTSELTFKPLQFIHIEPARLKECWPNCVLLLSIVPDFAAAKKTNASLSSYMNQDFKIMASNNYIELPEKHKVDLPLVKGEAKELLVDLKYHLDKEEITFNTYYTLGGALLKANVYTEKNPRCPTAEEDADFNFTGLQTSISLDSIKRKISENSMEDDPTPYLCILATAVADSKLSIEFTSDKNSIRTLAIDTVTALSLGSGQKAIYQIDLSQYVYLKITRDEGFPYFSKKLCKPQKGDIGKCVQEFENDETKGLQLADKVSTFDGDPCDKCTLLVKISSDEQSKIDLHVQSKYTEVELAENKPLSDALEAGEDNRYTLTGTKNEEIVINVQVLSGDLKVAVHDFEKIDITKTSKAGSKNIHIVIPPKDLAKEQKKLGQSYMTSFGLSSFVHLHLIVTAQDPKQSAIYTITYSSGEVIVYLQDGLISEYNLVAKKPTKFLYENPTNSEIYLHVTAPDAASLGKLGVKMYALDNPEDEDSMVSMTPEKPDFKKKTPNPTLLMKLPAKQAYYFEVTNNNDKDTLFTLGINNREIIYLPFDHEFPVYLTRADHIYLVLNTAIAGYIKISFSKCDESQPFIGYTLDYTEFINEDFQVEEQMGDELSQELILKVKQPGGVYLKLRSPDDDTTLMSVKATFSPNKIQSSKSKPGDKGLIQYQLLDSTKAELTFTSLVCGGTDKNCNKDFSYSSLSSNSVQNVYAQLVCPSIMFDLPEVQQLKAADVTAIPASSAKNNKMTFTQAIKGDIEYVGVKAVNGKTGEVVYYQPVEIVTFMGQLRRTSRTTFVLGLVLICVFACGAMIIYRRYKKNKEYNSLGELNDDIEQY